MNKTKKITLTALFIALAVVLRTFATVFLFGTTKFGFSFLPIVLSSAVLGTVYGGIVGGASDVVGYLIKPDGAFFPGFTISAILKGIIYGLFLFKKPKNILNISLAILTTIILVDLGINSIWINMLYGTNITAVIISKLATLPIYAGLQILILFIMFKYLDKEISKILE